MYIFLNRSNYNNVIVSNFIGLTKRDVQSAIFLYTYIFYVVYFLRLVLPCYSFIFIFYNTIYVPNILKKKQQNKHNLCNVCRLSVGMYNKKNILSGSFFRLMLDL